MSELKIAMVLGCLPNQRMNKRIQLEESIGDLDVVCWDRGNNMMTESVGHNHVMHVLDIPASSVPTKRILQFFVFYKEALKELKKIKPDIIHCQSLDTLMVACKYKGSVGNVKIIYEVPDIHPLLADKQKNPLKKALQQYLRHQDIKLEKQVDLLIITSEQYYDSYFKGFYDSGKVLYFPNVPVLDAFASYEKKEHREFTVGFIGSVRYKKQLVNLIDAGKKCGVKVLIAGLEVGEPEIEKLCEKTSNCVWIGKFDYRKEVAALYEQCDVIYSVYDADEGNVRVALPNKLYECIYCGIPIIVAKNTYLESVVKEMGIGISVSHRDEIDTIKAITKLRDDHAFYETAAKNCQLQRGNIDIGVYNKKLTDIINGWK